MFTEKSSDQWPMQIHLQAEEVEVDGWEATRWQVHDLLPDTAAKEGYVGLTLELHKDERSAYRFNLNSATPHLFVLCSEDETCGDLVPMHLTASQDEAASFMDGEHVLLETPMPAAVQCWIDIYLGIHGEQIDQGRKKKKRGKGRSSGR